MPIDYVPVETCDFRARCWVCGTTRDKEGRLTHRTGVWHERFDDHPLVQASEVEGWGRELRSVVIMALTKLMLAGQRSFRFPDIETLMPDGKWVEYARKRAAIYAAAAEWQDANRNESKPSKDQVRLAKVTRESFRKMQETSANRHLHVDHAELHRRITGDRS